MGMFDHFVGLALKGLTHDDAITFKIYHQSASPINSAIADSGKKKRETGKYKKVNILRIKRAFLYNKNYFP